MGLRPRFKTPFTQARDKLVAYAIRPFMVLQPRTRFLLGCAILVTLTTLLLITDYSSGFNEQYKEGEVLARDIVAPTDITAVDEAETEKENKPPAKQHVRFLIMTPAAPKRLFKVCAPVGENSKKRLRPGRTSAKTISSDSLQSFAKSAAVTFTTTTTPAG